MSVLTEAALRVLLKDADLEAMKEYRVESGVIVTPSARSWLLENKIDLIIGETCEASDAGPLKKHDAPQEPDSLPPKKNARYKLLGGGYLDEKPEHMTALHGMTLVLKSHRIICLRGKLDSLMARILEAQLTLKKLGLLKGAGDLEETLVLLRSIMRAEILGEALSPICLFGMEEAELRSRSHTPQKYYGISHFFASAEDGEAVVLLNSLRAASREVELEACKAFETESGESQRPDIIAALNRLSSAYYVMMFRAKAKEYEP